MFTNEQRLPCEENPEMWFPEGRTNRETAMVAELAIARCKQCPALVACMEFTAKVRPRPSEGVWAGKNYTKKRVK